MSDDRRRTILAAAITGVVLVAIGAAFLLTGSPQDERARRLDQARVTDLQALRSAIADHYDRTHAFPASLEELARKSPLPLRMTDPVGGRLYAYEVVDVRTFRLCAVFDLPTPDEEARMRADPWAHRAGRQCFRFRLRERDRREPVVPDAPVLEDGADSGP